MKIRIKKKQQLSEGVWDRFKERSAKARSVGITKKLAKQIKSLEKPFQKARKNLLLKVQALTSHPGSGEEYKQAMKMVDDIEGLRPPDAPEPAAASPDTPAPAPATAASPEPATAPEAAPVAPTPADTPDKPARSPEEQSAAEKRVATAASKLRPIPAGTGGTEDDSRSSAGRKTFIEPISKFQGPPQEKPKGRKASAKAADLRAKPVKGKILATKAAVNRLKAAGVTDERTIKQVSSIIKRYLEKNVEGVPVYEAVNLQVGGQSLLKQLLRVPGLRSVPDAVLKQIITDLSAQLKVNKVDVIDTKEKLRALKAEKPVAAQAKEEPAAAAPDSNRAALAAASEEGRGKEMKRARSTSEDPEQKSSTTSPKRRVRPGPRVINRKKAVTRGLNEQKELDRWKLLAGIKNDE